MRSPDHHGLFVGDLAGGDGVDLLDVLDLGNGLHGDNFYVSAIYDRMGRTLFLKSFLENFSFFSLLFARGVLCVRACQTGCNFLFQNVVNSRPLLPFFKGIEEFFLFVLGTKTFEANFFRTTR